MNEDKANKKDIERNDTELIANRAFVRPIFEGGEIKDIDTDYIEESIMV